MTKKTKNRLATFGLAACMSLAVLCSPAAEFPAQAAVTQDEGIMPMSDVYKWKFATMDCKLYKRLFNISKNCWAGEWIYVCDLTPIG